MTPEESNRIIAELEKYYIFSPTGNIFRISDDKHIGGTVLNSGHIQICLRGKKYYTHRLIAMKYKKNSKAFPVVNHKDGNPQNNAAGNLEWCTQRHNVLDYHAKFGGNVYKLNKMAIDLIRDIYMHKAMTQCELAASFELNQGYVSQIINNKRRQRDKRRSK